MSHRTDCDRCRRPIYYDHPGEIRCGRCGWENLDREIDHLRRECRQRGLDYRETYRLCDQDLEQLECLLLDLDDTDPLGHPPRPAERPALVCRYESVPTRPGPDEAQS
jgi:hypothetical protein